MRFSDAFIDDLRDRIRISEVVGSRVDFDRRKSNPSRGDHWFCCPVHGESNASAHCDDRKGFFKCFSCGASGDHFKFFMELDGVSFPRAIEMVADLAGVPLPDSAPLSAAEKRAQADRARQRSLAQADRARRQEREAAHRTEFAREIWQESRPIVGTLAEKYLLGRGIPVMAWPPSLRFHPKCKVNRDLKPALVCGVQANSRKLIAVWRIFLNPDGTNLIVDGRKVKLGLGPSAGGAVRLGAATHELAVCEGVETAFGIGCLSGWRVPVWSLLSTSGMVGWEPPEGVRRVLIYSDGDRMKVRDDGKVMEPPGRAAANTLREKLEAGGIEVAVHEPPEGSDWLDCWTTRNSYERRPIESANREDPLGSNAGG